MPTRGDSKPESCVLTVVAGTDAEGLDPPTPPKGSPDVRVVRALENAARKKAESGDAPVAVGSLVTASDDNRRWYVWRITGRVSGVRVASLREADPRAKKKPERVERPVEGLTLVRAALTPRDRYAVLREILPRIDPEGPRPDETVEVDRKGRCSCGQRHPRIASSVERDRIRTALTWKAVQRLGDVQHAALRIVETATLDYRKLADHVSVEELAKHAGWSTSKLGQALRELAELGFIDYLPGTGWIDGDTTGTIPSWVRLRVPANWQSDRNTEDSIPNGAEGVSDNQIPRVTGGQVPGVSGAGTPGVSDDRVPPVSEDDVPRVSDAPTAGVPASLAPSHETPQESFQESIHEHPHEAGVGRAADRDPGATTPPASGGGCDEQPGKSLEHPPPFEATSCHPRQVGAVLAIFVSAISHTGRSVPPSDQPRLASEVASVLRQEAHTAGLALAALAYWWVDTGQQGGRFHGSVSKSIPGRIWGAYQGLGPTPRPEECLALGGKLGARSCRQRDERDGTITKRQARRRRTEDALAHWTDDDDDVTQEVKA